MRRLFRYFLLGLILLLVCLGSALLAMRFAIHGREVLVPRLQGLATADAERVAGEQGLIVYVENKFYSPDVPEGHIVSQAPAAGAKVRRGGRVRVAQSLGPQRSGVPNVIGQSERVAAINISRRGLEIGTVAAIRMPGAAPRTVVAQNPAPDAKTALSPKIGLIVASNDSTQTYVMPNFVEHSITEAITAVEEAGFTLGKTEVVEDMNGPSGIVLRQFPPAGQRIPAGAVISFVVRK
ncbi:MAG TPA: PASTA domain-containing protein [Candidatus Angelobacter sp.]|nr:PASTA domain-containing protein [Candidatus Angelobacter sp.]